ncbi:MAG: GNAT family N-acetyltransferase [Rhodospirillaceae bacterium]
MIFVPDDLKTRRCRIAALRTEDARALQAITDASVISRVHFLSAPFTLADAEALIRGGEDGHRFFGVWSREAPQLFGVVGATPRSLYEIEVGYWFAAAARGRGLAGEAVEAMAAALADRNPVSRIVAECRPDNRPSWQLLERVGFASAGRKGERPGREMLFWRARSGVRFDVC